MQCTSPVYLNIKQEKGYPCGKCRACRISRAREWATRIVHESMTVKDCSFVTLTVDSDEDPLLMQLNKVDFQLFMKRYRKEIYPRKVRYYAALEYGKKHGRPHFHVILFGSNARTFQVRQQYWHNEEGEIIEKAWGKGFVYCGTVTYDSARYVSDYVHKIDDREEVWAGRPEPFLLCSRGIGRNWVKENSDQLERRLEMRIREGIVVGLPRYYRKVLCERPDYKDKGERMAAELAAKEKLKEAYQEKWKDKVVREGFLARRQRDRNIKSREGLYNKGTL